ncbi:hypothetical protein EDC96DRAFT_569574 [Choanephora cucurbitarum]|nr:hypothetical protein EDC96DRAFT_569574 [Choanephora cucurbitarum]
MLQEYPTQIQPRSSSTRNTQDVTEQQSSTSPTDKIDAEASRILIDLANQDTNTSSSSDTSEMMIVDCKLNKRRRSTKTSLPIKTEANLHNLEQERFQPDPIMLLAAAAAVIDDEGNYKGRLYERREIKLHGRQGSFKRKSFTYGSTDINSIISSRSSSSDSGGNINHHSNSPSGNTIYRRHSEKRYQHHQRASVLDKPGTNKAMLDHMKENVSQTEDTHAFSWQYLSMVNVIQKDNHALTLPVKKKQNPHIKRNAMHAYITYMIYTDMAHERRPDSKALYSNTVTSTQHPQQQQKYSSTKEETGRYGGLTSSLPNWLEKKKNSPPPKQQSYKLPPSPRQRHDLPPPPTESIIGRPLTDFLFEKKKPSLLPPPNTNYLSSSTNTSQTSSRAFFD